MTASSVRQSASGFFRQYKAAFLAAVFSGLAAHGYALTNKLLNSDEINSLFGKGASYTSGRWGLELFRFLFPAYSMPWLWGLLTVLFFAVSACILLDVFSIRNRILQCLLAGLTTALPSVTGLLCYMFTSSVFGFALLLSVCSVWLYERQRWPAVGAALVLMTLALGVYQSYVSLAAGVFVLLMLQELATGTQTAGQVFLAGVKRLCFLLASLACYYAISLLALRLTGKEFETYAFNENGILLRLLIGISAFLHTLTSRYFYFVNSTASQLAHYLGLALAGGVIIGLLRKMGDLRRVLLFLLCLALFPIALYSVYLLAVPGVIHTLVLSSFVLVYFFTAVLCELWQKNNGSRKNAVTDLCILSLGVVLLSNIWFANGIYLKLQVDYETAYSTFTRILTRIEACEDYTEGTPVAIIGYAYTGSDVDEQFGLDTDQFAPVSDNLYNAPRENFFRYYLGYAGPFASQEEARRIIDTEEFRAMPYYPNDGAVRMINGVVVVKMSEPTEFD